MTAENSGKPLGGRPEPRRGSSQRSPDPLAGGERVAAPPQEPHPRSRRSVLASNERSWARPWLLSWHQSAKRISTLSSQVPVFKRTVIESFGGCLSE